MRAERRQRPEIAPAPALAADGDAVTGWRPGARWARTDPAAPLTRQEDVARVEAEIAALPLHQRPQMRELGRRSEAAPMPFRAMPPDEGVPSRANPPFVEPRPRHRPSDPPLQPDSGAALRHAFADTTKLRRSGSNSCDAGEAKGLPLRQMVREFPTMPERGRWDRDAGSTRRTPSSKSTLELCGYDLEGAFWQSPHAIAGEVRHRWDDPARFAGPDRPPPRPAAAPAPSPAPAGPAPLVTRIRDGARLTIAAACPAAQALGLAAGQPLASARALVPGLDVRDADPAGDMAFLHRLAVHAVRHWTPLAAVSDPTGLWIEASAAHLMGGEAAFATRILRTLRRHGHDARIAIADTPGAAHALARHGGAAITLCPPGAQAEALAPLPITALRLDEAAEARLRRLGVTQVGALAAIPSAPLVRRFGRLTADRIAQALGARGEPIEGVLPPETPLASCRFLEPILTAEAIATALAKLAGELCDLLTARGLGARRIAMLCRRVDGRDEVATIGTARGTRDPAHLRRLMEARIETIDPGFGIEAMRLVAPRCDRLDPYAIGGLEPAPPDLAALVDMLVTRLGPGRLYRATGRESDVPERGARRAGPLARPAPLPASWPRPLLLLTRPEPLTQVIAELPDQPPVRFGWRGQLHRVVHADGPERIHGEWWRSTAEADAVRDYFAVEDEVGRRFWLFRRGDGTDLRTGDMSWHLHGLFGQ
ncbi:protein ImuB [Sphingomonas jatrophae]|uniref:Protein ImuB n=1 Tax=Sphingomonas jatrophae TaxID=1166337 RepID=A0A1I6MAI2_9SPHN|nr:protein ImuB [Sphingomonas jatrophae]